MESASAKCFDLFSDDCFYVLGLDEEHPLYDRLIQASHKGLNAAGVPSGGPWLNGSILKGSVAHFAMVGAATQEANNILSEQCNKVSFADMQTAIKLLYEETLVNNGPGGLAGIDDRLWGEAGEDEEGRAYARQWGALVGAVKRCLAGSKR
jgi:hypothetical protein